MADLRSRSREPFGPRQPGVWGALLRFSQWALVIIIVVCLWPGVMLALSAVLDGFMLLRDAATPAPQELLRWGDWLTWAVLLVMTGLRVTGQWYRWWAFMPVAAANAALMLCTKPDAVKDPEGVYIWQLMLGVTVAQCLLHGLWSLCARRLHL